MDSDASTTNPASSNGKHERTARTSDGQRRLRYVLAALGGLLIIVGIWALLALSGRPQALLSAFIALGLVSILMSFLRFKRKELTIEFILAVIGVLTLPYTVWTLGAQGVDSPHLSIDQVSFSTNDGEVTLVVSGIYHAQSGDGYLFAVARPSRIPYGTANWLVSEPVTPGQNGRWTADITLTTAESRQKMTVFAVLAGGCPPGAVCAAPPEAVRQEIEQEGPQSGDYWTTARMTSAAPTIQVSGPNALLSSADMEQAVGGSWQAAAATPRSLTFSCFPLPANPSTSHAVELSEALGAKLYEVVDTFATIAAASQAYTSFISTTNNCSWENTSQEGVTSQFTVVADSNAPNLASKSSLWNIKGVPMDLGGPASYDGAICAIQSGNLDAFAFIVADVSSSPTLQSIENNIEPVLAQKL